jgi:hypothetical protein
MQQNLQFQIILLAYTFVNQTTTKKLLQCKINFKTDVIVATLKQ